LDDEVISVVVVNWNGRHLLDACLASLQHQTRPAAEVILVDNGSTDESIRFVRSEYPAVRVIALDTNRGFAAGCNAGLGIASGSLIATLNNDAVADERWLDALARTLRGRHDVGMVASKMLRRDNPAVVDSAGICIDRTAVVWDRKVGEPADSANAPAEVFGPCAGAALYRRELFSDVGCFDEDFFMYLEDVDLAWRARLAGWRCLYCPDAIAFHSPSTTAGVDSPLKLFHLARNRIWLLAKNYPMPDLVCRFPALVAFEIGASISSLIRPRPAFTVAQRLAPLSGRIAGLLRLRTAWRKRSTVQSHRRVPHWRVTQELEPIVWMANPFGIRGAVRR
jgi:GT2 family glycosyltransferase